MRRLAAFMVAVYAVALGAFAGITGDWVGTTSQNRAITFTVDSAGAKITTMSYSHTTCGTTTATASNITISNNSFSADFGGFCPRTVVSGTFSSSTSASGTIALTYTPIPNVCFCSGSASIPWNAANTSTPANPAPTITITSPTTASTYQTGSVSLALAGTAADDTGVASVTWTNSRGGSGTATGTTSWSIPSITLQTGSNVITVTATDGAGATGTATLTVTYTRLPSLSLDRTSLSFGGVSSGTSLTAQTPAQTVRLTQSGSGTVTWTAASNRPWLTVTPASGSGPATLSVGVKFDAALPASGTTTGAITLTPTGAANTPGPINVTMNVASSTAAASLPFGSFDTPAGDSTVLAGSVAVTGWTLDNIGVKQVEIWRDLQPGETTPPFSGGASDPRTGKIFIANATFVEGARPDVEGLYPATPANYRSGWGYLMLTWGLFGQGNGTYRFYAFGVDQENNTATIGTKTVVISNNTATKPFGSIDTPAIGGDASGPNFGWGLTPKVNGVATCKIQPSGVQYAIDSGPLQPVIYGAARPDIAGAFPGFSNTAGAGGHAIIDWSALTNGPHTIGWLITDDCNRADGVGSRFFNVTTGTSALTAPDFRLKAETTEIEKASALTEAPLPNSVVSAFRRNVAEGEGAAAVLLSRGYGELPAIVDPDSAGSRTIDVKQGERIELRLPRGFDSAYQLGPMAQGRPLPIGSTWDKEAGIFYWQPAPGFLGRYRLVFGNGSERISVRVVVLP